MGVESDQLVFDYLSRIGDLAQTALPAAQRMRLVAQVRTDIDRERKGVESPAAVRRILDRIGAPDDVVDAAAGTLSGGRGRTDSWDVSGHSEEPSPGYYPSYPAPKAGAAGHHGPGGPGGLGDEGDLPGEGDAGIDWWSVESPDGPLRAGEELAGLPGMTGGVTIPFDDRELAGGKPRIRKRPVPVPAADPSAKAAAEEVPATPGTGRRWRPRLPGTRSTGGKGWGSPGLLLAAALLVAGAAIGSLIPIGLGWLLGYLSRRLSRPQAKFGIVGIPGTVGLGMLVWLWGRDAGRWSTPIAEGQLAPAIQDALPTTIRVAAIASALYLLWRARRP